MKDIRFGTDGWREVIAAGFTVDHVARVAWAVARWLVSSASSPSVVVGHDTRFGGRMFAETLAKVLSQKGVKVYLSPGVVTTPMLSYGVKVLGARAGLMVTASHNAPRYSGIKLKGPHGGPLDAAATRMVEGLVPDVNEVNLPVIRWERRLQDERVTYTDLEELYYGRVTARFGEVLRQKAFRPAFDVMYGAALRIVPRLFPGALLLHGEENPLFGGMAPDPVPSRLLELSERMRREGSYDLGVALDGDADRVTLLDAGGTCVDAHHLILLLVHHLAGRKNLHGKVVTGITTTHRLEELCRRYGLEVQRTPVGFKEVSAVMRQEEVLLGGEESGSFALPDHLPERDGLWVALTVMEAMMETGKSLRQLLDEVEEITGPFACDRADLPMSDEQRRKVLRRCAEGAFSAFGPFRVTHMLEFDGYKYFFGDGEWLMVRPSGTQQLLRLYAEAEDAARVEAILRAAYETLTAEEKHS